MSEPIAPSLSHNTPLEPQFLITGHARMHVGDVGVKFFTFCLERAEGNNQGRQVRALFVRGKRYLYPVFTTLDIVWKQVPRYYLWCL